MAGFIPVLIYRQLFVTPPYPTFDFSGQTIIVTGASAGLGLETARHLVRLNAKRVILAVRSATRGEAAKKSIEESTGKTGVAEVWSLDLDSYESVKAFAKQAETLDRLDALLENAGIQPEKFRLAEGNESSITTNVVSTYLLALLLLPKLRETGQKYNIVPRLSVVSSEVHHFSRLPEKSAPNIFDRLNEPSSFGVGQIRYNVSKLLEVFYSRELAARTDGKVMMNYTNPGFCYSNLAPDHWGPRLFKWLLARTTEVGSRTFVYAVADGPQTHGEFLSDATIDKPAKFVTSPEGQKLQKRVWNELNEKLEKIVPGITQNV